MLLTIYKFVGSRLALHKLTPFQLHYAVQHESGKPLGIFLLFRPSAAEITVRNTPTSITFKYVAGKLEQSWATVHKEYCENEGRKKHAGKKALVGKKLGKKSG